MLYVNRVQVSGETLFVVYHLVLASKNNFLLNVGFPSFVYDMSLNFKFSTA